MSLWKRAGCQTESKALEKSIVDRIIVYNITFDPDFAERFSERYVISERADTSFPNVLIHHFRTCKYVISERVDT